MSSSLNNAERFLNAYAEIEHELQRILNLKEYRRFYDLLERAARFNPVIDRYKFDLRKYGDLRNAIVHDRIDGMIIAQPNDDTVSNIEKIARLLLKPPAVVPLFKKEVATIPVEASLARAIRVMGKHRYSQVPVIDEGSVTGLLTSNMIVRWMGVQLEKGEINLHDTAVSEVLPFSGSKDNYKVVASRVTLFDVLELFINYREAAHKLEAVLITPNGRPEEQVVGIITNFDLPLLQRELD